MTDEDAPLELRSTPDDATIREGLRRAYRPYVLFVLALFLVVVPPLTLLRAWIDGAWLVRTLLALFVMGLGAWSTGRALRSLVQTSLGERTGREITLTLPPGTRVGVRETERAIVLRHGGTIVLAKRDVSDEALRRLRAMG